jgi:hypothetical protein
MRRRQFLLAAAASLLLPQMPARAQTGNILRVGNKHPFKTVAEASRAAQDGDTVEIEAAEYVGDVAVWTQSNLTIRGVNGRPQMVAGGASAENKGIWVMRGGDVRVENVALRGARVPHFNGSGIRHERGRLHVSNVRFVDNEMGILTANRPELELRIEGCEFVGPAEVKGDVPHNLYVGLIGRLEVTGSYFHRARKGHLLKSRARENFVAYNRLSDETGNASYEMEFPAGGKVLAIGNIIHQGKGTQNSNIVSYAAEGWSWDENSLLFAHNTFVNSAGSSTWITSKPGNGQARLWRNLYVGKGDLGLRITTNQEENFSVDEDELVDVDGGDYRLRKRSDAARSLPPPRTAGPEIPHREYIHPMKTAALGRPDRWSPGAFQSLG